MSRKIGGAFVALVALLLLSAGFQGTPAAAASTPTPSFDSTLFLSTVPSYAILGHNYTVKLLVTNSLNTSMEVLVRLNSPVGAVYTWPLLQDKSLEPGEETLFNFTLVAFGDNSGKPMNVTAMLWIWPFNTTSTPQLVQTASKLIDGVSPSQQAVAAAAVVLVAVIAISGLLVLRHVKRSRAKGKKEAGALPPQPLPGTGHQNP